MAYLEQSTRYIAYDARLGGRYRYYRDPEVLGSPLGTRYVGDIDRLFDTYAELLAELMPTACARALPEGARRLRLRLPPGDQGQGVRRAARHPARGVAVERRHLRHRPGATRRCCCACAPTRCPRPARYARPDARRAAQGHPVVPHAGSTVADRGGALERLPRRRPATATARAGRRAVRGRRRPSRGPSVHARRLRSRRRGQAPRGDLLPAHRTCPRTSSLARVRAHRRRRARRAACGPTSGSGATAGTSRAGRSSASTTASTSSPTTARSATCSATACSPSSGSRFAAPRLRRAPSRSTRPAWPTPFDDAMDRSAALYDALARRASRSRRRTRCRSRTGCAS